jgi:phosphatidylglycerol:prolipoprotein diacylglycerol transferase
MLPELRLFGGLTIPSYGLMLFVSFVVGIVLFERRMRRRRVLPGKLSYNWAWIATDVAISAIVLAAGIWAIGFAPGQWAALRERPAAFHWLFRLLVLVIAGYLEYGGIRHLRAHVRAREIEGGEFITYLALWVLFSAIAGSRLLYVALHWPEFAHDLIGTFAFWRGGLHGLMFYGGLVGALVMGVAFAAINRLPLLRLLDAAMPSILLGEFFTRIGCFLNGCCFGQACSLPWAVRFPPGSLAAGSGLGNQAIHPTQLYSSLAGLILFVVALVLERRNWRSGMLFGFMLLLYAAFRFGIDFLRFYENTANFLINQGISLALGGVAVAIMLAVAHRGAEPGRPK